jgi:hypothetical protein
MTGWRPRTSHFNQKGTGTMLASAPQSHTHSTSTAPRSTPRILTSEDLAHATGIINDVSYQQLINVTGEKPVLQFNLANHCLFGIKLGRTRVENPNFGCIPSSLIPRSTLISAGDLLSLKNDFTPVMRAIFAPMSRLTISKRHDEIRGQDMANFRIVIGSFEHEFAIALNQISELQAL